MPTIDAISSSNATALSAYPPNNVLQDTKFLTGIFSSALPFCQKPSQSIQPPHISHKKLSTHLKQIHSAHTHF